MLGVLLLEDLDFRWIKSMFFPFVTMKHVDVLTSGYRCLNKDGRSLAQVNK